MQSCFDSGMKAVLFLVLAVCCCTTHAQSISRLSNLGRLYRLQHALAVESKRAENYGLAQKSTIRNLKASSLFFNVALPNDSIILVKGRIDFQNFPNSLIESGRNGRVFSLANTQFISALNENGNEFIGIPGDSTWLFRVSSNKINLYASVPYYVWDCVVAIQKGDNGLSLQLNPKNLEEMLSDNEDALQFFNAGRIEDAISVYNGMWIDKNKQKRQPQYWPNPLRE
jgi:hypothetical protein